MSSLSGKSGPRIRHLVDENDSYETIAVEKLTPIIGAEISGVDLGSLASGDARSNRQMDEIRRALAENLVIFFRDPEPGQTLIDVCEAERAFVHRVRELHPDSPKPAIVGNCQGGWAAMMLAAADPDDTGPS